MKNFKKRKMSFYILPVFLWTLKIWGTVLKQGYLKIGSHQITLPKDHITSLTSRVRKRCKSVVCCISKTDSNISWIECVKCLNWVHCLYEHIFSQDASLSDDAELNSASTKRFNLFKHW